MRAISRSVQLRFVAASFAAVVIFSAILIIERYVQHARHPADVAASSGMYAFGDLLLEVFIAGALLVPTFLLVLVIRKSEAAYTVYSKVLLVLSLSAPLSLGLLCIPEVSSGPGWLGFVCLYRLEVSPFTLAAAGFSRIAAHFQAPKRLTLYALLAEGVTLVALVSVLVFSVWSHHG